MSAELSQARQQMSQIRSMLKQGKVQPAVKTLHDNLITILKTHLMKAEREEFEQMVDEAVYVLATDLEIKRKFPLPINYIKGEEKNLLEHLRSMLESFDTSILDSANEAKKLQEERKRKILIDTEQMFSRDEASKARDALNRAAREFRDNPEYLGEIGLIFLKFAQYEDAVLYLETAINQQPDLVPLYNHIGIALRKLQKFDVAEKYYLKASEYLSKDPNLFFNLGRLYVDWKQWKKAIMAANGALKLKPDFIEAQKLVSYAEKQLAEKGNV